MSQSAAISAGMVPGIGIRVGLWVAQAFIGLNFLLWGWLKLSTPIADLSTFMPWTGQVPETFVRFIGCGDITGGIGILLPALTRIFPRLTVLAALGCTTVQVLAISFHVSRGEFMVLPLNIILLPLCIFVLWGRWKKAPIAPRF